MVYAFVIPKTKQKSGVSQNIRASEFRGIEKMFMTLGMNLIEELNFQTLNVFVNG